MFTGIVEEKGTLKQLMKNKQSLRLVIEGSRVIDDISIGDSISVNGVCLTVTTHGNCHFTVDVIPETFRSTSLSAIKVGSQLNLERAIPASGRFGGHFVSGHVDTVGTIDEIWNEANARYMSISIGNEGLKYVALKGSITIDGTSLTVFGLRDNSFVISLIPETQRATVLGNKKQGDIVNVEYDVLAKYMEQMLTVREKVADSRLTIEKLHQYGFTE